MIYLTVESSEMSKIKIMVLFGFDQMSKMDVVMSQVHLQPAQPAQNTNRKEADDEEGSQGLASK